MATSTTCIWLSLIIIVAIADVSIIAKQSSVLANMLTAAAKAVLG